MPLALSPPFPPMEALSVSEVPVGPQWQYEPKWDGFRCLVFRDGDKVELQSKSGQPLTRYYPELVEVCLKLQPSRFVLDGEIVIPEGDTFSFDALLQRIHPAPSRIKRLASETPALLIVFDLLAGADGKALTGLTLADRRGELEAFARTYLGGSERIRLSPVTTDLDNAKGWLDRVGGTLDGIVAKRRDLPYCSGERTGMQKIKNYRTADCVIGGFRYGTDSALVGSLLLGLYDEAGLLHHVGFTSGIKAAERESLTERLKPLIEAPGFTGQAPGGPSRWSTKRSGEWEPLRPELVVEVRFDHFAGGRFRHGTTLVRWRPDKAPRQCTYEQLESKKADLMKLLTAKATPRAAASTPRKQVAASAPRASAERPRKPRARRA